MRASGALHPREGGAACANKRVIERWRPNCSFRAPLWTYVLSLPDGLQGAAGPWRRRRVTGRDAVFPTYCSRLVSTLTGGEREIYLAATEIPRALV